MQIARVVGDRAETKASIEAQKATVEQAKLDLGFTKVIAPVTGRVGRALVTEGNLVQAGPTGGTLLTTLLPLLQGTAGTVDIGALVGQAVGGGVAGAILTAIVGLIKNNMSGQPAR